MDVCISLERDCENVDVFCFLFFSLKVLLSTFFSWKCTFRCPTTVNKREIWQLSWVRDLICHENALEVIWLVWLFFSGESYLLVSLFSLSSFFYQKQYIFNFLYFCLDVLFSDLQSIQKSWFYYSAFKGV